MLSEPPSRMLPAMASLRDDFLRYVSQTSPAPMGVAVARSHGCVVTDTNGREYLDLLSGIGVTGIGHTHPAVVRAVQAQAEQYLHAMVYGEYIQKPQVDLARRLAELTPGELSVTYFTNSGTEAVEGALKTARKYTGRSGFVSFVGSFHGDTFGSVSVGGNPVYRDPFEPLLPRTTFLPFNDRPALYTIDETIAAVIIEPIQGEGGVRIPDNDYLPALRQRCSEVGALLIFDEVITGFGRTGRLFANEHWQVTPDILVVAKALAAVCLSGRLSVPRRLWPPCRTTRPSPMSRPLAGIRCAVPRVWPLSTYCSRIASYSEPRIKERSSSADWKPWSRPATVLPCGDAAC